MVAGSNRRPRYPLDFLLKCGRTSADIDAMRHATTLYALDGGAREIRCTCGFTRTPDRGTPMEEIARQARAHRRSATLEEELTAMERQDRRVFGRID